MGMDRREILTGSTGGSGIYAVEYSVGLRSGWSALFHHGPVVCGPAEAMQNFPLDGGSPVEGDGAAVWRLTADGCRRR
ncbi:MAG: hypothetical protein KAT00_07150 [Planctomycetes bacterium]|nr:hypothetical protein [Planctomycetota bacterium]